MKTRYVTTVTVTDPDSKAAVEVEIRKTESGGMVGIDGSFLEQDVGPVYSPYDEGVVLEISDDEKTKEHGVTVEVYDPSRHPQVDDCDFMVVAPVASKDLADTVAQNLQFGWTGESNTFDYLRGGIYFIAVCHA